MKRTFEPDFFLGNLEREAHDHNLLLAIYEESKLSYGVRPNIEDLTTLASVGEVSVSGVNLKLAPQEDKGFVNNVEVEPKPLFKGDSNSIDLDYKNQRKLYLEGVIRFQSLYIEHDSRGRLDIFGHEDNNSLNTRYVDNALSELAGDTENINPNQLFKTEMTATQKVRLISSHIDNEERALEKLSRKLVIEESAAIEKPLVDLHLSQSVKGIMSGTIDAISSMKRDRTHEIDSNHAYVKEVLKGTEGLNDTKNFSISHLKPMPKDYQSQQSLLRKSLQVTYENGETKLSIISKQLIAYQEAKEVLQKAPKVDFEKGVDLDRLFVSTKRLAGSDIIDGKNSVIDGQGVYEHVTSGEFGLPRSSLLNKPIKSYEAIVIGIGASSAGALSTALKHNDNILVIDALREDNVDQVLFDIRENYSKPISVFTSNMALDNFLKQSGDRNIKSNFLQDKEWGELGIDTLRSDRFNEFVDLVESKLQSASFNSNLVDKRPEIRASLNNDVLSQVDTENEVSLDFAMQRQPSF